MAELLEVRLQSFLRRSCSVRFEWGRADCGLWLADWLMERFGIPDPAVSLRGRYSDEASCDAILEAPYPVVFGRLLRRAGLRATNDPKPGDVAVVREPGGSAVGAIRSAVGWTVLSSRGLIGLPPDTHAMMAWGEA